MAANLDDARRAKAQLAALLAGHPLVNGVGVTRIDDGWAVQVNLSESPADERALPEDVDGVQVRYDTIGPIVKR